MLECFTAACVGILALTMASTLFAPLTCVPRLTFSAVHTLTFTAMYMTSHHVQVINVSQAMQGNATERLEVTVSIHNSH